jgi:hypothetical protein
MPKAWPEALKPQASGTSQAKVDVGFESALTTKASHEEISRVLQLLAAQKPLKINKMRGE